jgi:hypothetical protein
MRYLPPRLVQVGEVERIVDRGELGFELADLAIELVDLCVERRRIAAGLELVASIDESVPVLPGGIEDLGDFGRVLADIGGLRPGVLQGHCLGGQSRLDLIQLLLVVIDDALGRLHGGVQLGVLLLDVRCHRAGHQHFIGLGLRRLALEIAIDAAGDAARRRAGAASDGRSLGLAAEKGAEHAAQDAAEDGAGGGAPGGIVLHEGVGLFAQKLLIGGHVPRASGGGRGISAAVVRIAPAAAALAGRGRQR